MAAQTFRLRALATLIVTLSFCVLALSGLALFIKPPGWWANQANWTWLGIAKPGWDALHTNLALLFVLGSLVHLWFNWKPLLHHLRTRSKYLLRPRAELWVAAALVLCVSIGTVAGWPPLNLSATLREDIKTHWTGEPVAAHAPAAISLHDAHHPGQGTARGFGRMTVQQACQEAGVSVPDAIEALANAGVWAGPNDRLRWTADALGTTPRAVFERIASLQ